jgi:tRNA (guanine-N7-)-methyltransferase
MPTSATTRPDDEDDEALGPDDAALDDDAPLDEDGDDRNRGLIGGDLARRVATSRVPPIDHRFVLAPYRTEGHEAAVQAFVAHRPLHIEIGFGRPHYLLDLAAMHPEAHLLGFEIKRRWVRAAAERADRLGLGHVRVIEGDARPHLEALVPPGSADGIHVLFPDPWWKKKHHKKRVFNRAFTALMARTLAPDGALCVKTDVEAYADLLVEELTASGLVLAGSGTSDPVLASLPRSHREKKCAEFGVPIHLFRFVHPDVPPVAPVPPAT